VPDFGEHLVDVRERLEGPLPPRVRPWRVFLAATLEGFCLGLLWFVKRNYRTLLTGQHGLADFDLDVVLAAFKELDARTASRDQIEQAKLAFEEQMRRRVERINYELGLWFAAMRAGRFFGTLLFCLLAISISMAVVTDHDPVVPILVVLFALAEVIVTAICANDWHRP
jgi:hypothetical protein